jgi:hypothetical protein
VLLDVLLVLVDILAIILVLCLEVEAKTLNYLVILELLKGKLLEANC